MRAALIGIRQTTISDTMARMVEFYSFGAWLRARRRALDLTQRALADLAFCSTVTIKKIESDQRRPSRELAHALANALGMPQAQQASFIECARGLRPVDALGSATEASIPGVPPPLPTNLPSPLTSLVNRVQAIDDLSALLQRDGARLVTLIGPPGIGKTRLSIQCGEFVRPHFPGGVWFVDLSAVTEPELVLPAVATVLDASQAMQASIESIRWVLGDQPVLLVLDNLEQVVAGAASDVTRLLQACRGLKILATSRARLDVSGEHEYHVPPLSLPPEQHVYEPEALLAYESVQLLVTRIRQHRPDFVITEGSATAVAELCRRLEGVPLALELAAARVRQVSVNALAQALADPSSPDGLLTLDSTARDLPPRQRTLYNAIAWSYATLTPLERTVLCQLGVFVGSFDTEAATAVCEPSAPSSTINIAAILNNLADLSLLARQNDGSLQQWRLLEMIREFALAHLEPIEAALARQRHAHHFIERVQGVTAVYSPDAYLTAVEPHHNNLRAALDWAIEQKDAPLAMALCHTMGRYWELRGYHREGLPRVYQTLALSGKSEPPLRFSVLWTGCNLEWQQHAFERAQDLATQASELARRHHLKEQLPRLFDLQGRIYLEQGNYAQARHVLKQGVALARERPDLRNPGYPLTQLGEVEWASGQASKAREIFEEALGYLADETTLFAAMAWTDLAEIAISEDDFPTALHALQKALPHATIYIRRGRCLLVTLAGYLLHQPGATPANGRSAALLLGAEAGLGDLAGSPLAPFQQELVRHRRLLIEKLLPSHAWQVAWDTGRRWSLEQALTKARGIMLAASDR